MAFKSDGVDCSGVRVPALEKFLLELTTTQQLVPNRCIRQRLLNGRRCRWDFERNGQDVMSDVPGALTLDNTGLIVEAAVAGLGIGCVPERAAPARNSRNRPPPSF